MTRRSLLRRAAVAGTVAWTAPVITTFDNPVAAAAGSLSCPAIYCFDDGTTEGWTIDNTAGPGKDGLWNIDNSRSTSASYSLHYGRGSSSDYAIGGRHSGSVTSPSIALPSSGTMNLEFEVWREVETASGGEDAFEVSILPSGDLLYSAAADGGTGGVFESISIDLSAYAGDTIEIVFTFDTGDGTNNNFEGVYVDDVSIPCSTPPAAPGAAPPGVRSGFFPAGGPEPTEAEQAERYLRELTQG
ncbi:MAG: choice-of-anchor J domain-containing protein [Acidimicrobiales bacterium]